MHTLLQTVMRAVTASTVTSHAGNVLILRTAMERTDRVATDVNSGTDWTLARVESVSTACTGPHLKVTAWRERLVTRSSHVCEQVCYAV